MNEYRILMIVLGFGIILPELIFLWKLRTGKDPLNKPIGLAQRLRSVALTAGGIRIVTLYWKNPTAGTLTPLSDHIISVGLTALAATAAWVSLFVYFRIRRPLPSRQVRRAKQRRKADRR